MCHYVSLFKNLWILFTFDWILSATQSIVPPTCIFWYTCRQTQNISCLISLNCHFCLFNLMHTFCRFNTTSNQPTDFAADTSLVTAWTSKPGETPVTFHVGLSSSTTPYKIFVTFSTSYLYLSAILEVKNSADSSSTSWQTLQHYAKNCSTTFGVEPEQP